MSNISALEIQTPFVLVAFACQSAYTAIFVTAHAAAQEQMNIRSLKRFTFDEHEQRRGHTPARIIITYRICDGTYVLLYVCT